MAGIECPACGTVNEGGAEAFCAWCGLELSGSEAGELRRMIARLVDVDRELFEVGDRRARLAAGVEVLRFGHAPFTDQRDGRRIRRRG